jgi:hypothetical protein
MKPHFFAGLAAMAAILAVGLPATVQAQSLPYGDVGGVGASSDSSVVDDAADESDTPTDGIGLIKHTGRLRITPYIEAQQVVTGELSPGNEVLTYSTLAAGVDANLTGRNAEAGVAVRYERRFGWGSNRISDGDVVSGVARGSVGIIPHTLFLEGGATAARLSVQNNGSTSPGLELGNSSAQVYSAYIGPAIKAQLGAVNVEGHYRFGYSRVTTPNALPVAAGQTPIDLYDEGTVHNALIHFGTRAGTVLPIGVGVGAGWNREDTSNLDQRIDDKHVRGDVTLPVGLDLALVAGVGYERVQVSQRDALIDTLTGLPVVSDNGRYVTDRSRPRQIAYESEGLFWDAGVLWRPSRRTALEAHVGKRYGSTTYFGSFAYAPNSRATLNVSVYDGISGFGGRLNQALADLPTQFDGLRNPLTGGLSTCVVGVPGASGTNANSAGGCLNGVLGSVRSASFRGRGVMASLGLTGNNLQYGLGAGYDRRSFIAAPGTVLALANGVIDQNYWIAAYLNGRIDRNSSFGTNVWANWYQSGDALAGNTSAIGATAAYYRSLASNLTATAAVGMNGISRETLQDIWTASGLVGLRYSF